MPEQETEKKSDPKYPLKGMPFDRAELSEMTKIIYREARRPRRPVVRHLEGVRGGHPTNLPFVVERPGKPGGWAEARRRAYRALVMKHFPSHHKRYA